MKLKVSDIAPGGALRDRATVIQQKTGRPVPFEITEPTREALVAWLQRRGRRADDWLFPSRSREGEAPALCGVFAVHGGHLHDQLHKRAPARLRKAAGGRGSELQRAT